MNPKDKTFVSEIGRVGLLTKTLTSLSDGIYNFKIMSQGKLDLFNRNNCSIYFFLIEC